MGPAHPDLHPSRPRDVEAQEENGVGPQPGRSARLRPGRSSSPHDDLPRRPQGIGQAVDVHGGDQDRAAPAGGRQQPAPKIDEIYLSWYTLFVSGREAIKRLEEAGWKEV